MAKIRRISRYTLSRIINGFTVICNNYPRPVSLLCRNIRPTIKPKDVARFHICRNVFKDGFIGQN